MKTQTGRMKWLTPLAQMEGSQVRLGVRSSLPSHLRGLRTFRFPPPVNEMHWFRDCLVIATGHIVPHVVLGFNEFVFPKDCPS